MGLFINVTFRSSHQRCSIKKGVMRNYKIFTGKRLYQNLFLNKVFKNFIKKETLVQVFSCGFCEISHNTFLTEHLRTTASEHCSTRYILINTFHIFYIKFHHRNVILFLFSSRFYPICLFFTSNGVWGADLVLKLSKSFKKK